MPQQYGPVITVERLMKQKGPSSCKLINATTGRTISTRADDLERMVDQASAAAAPCYATGARSHPAPS